MAWDRIRKDSYEDDAHALGLIRHFSTSPRQSYAYVKSLEVCAEDFVRLPPIWKAIGAVATALLQHGALGRAATRQIIRDSLHPMPRAVAPISGAEVAG